MTQRHILYTWLPLAISAMLMTGEILLVQSAVSRLPDEKTMLAALGVMFWLEVLIEAPVIMLLSTSTALTTTPQAYRVLRRFMLHLVAAMTAVAVAVAFVNPLYDLVLRQVMGIPEAVAGPTQTGMQIMSLWTAAIGWRRFNQGILIRFGQARQVTWGTLVRLSSSALTAGSLVLYGQYSGIVVAATTFMAGVTAEALYAFWKSRPIVRQHLTTAPEPSAEPLTYRAVLSFHLPLAATSTLSFIVIPLINAGLARMPAPAETLAAWPVLYSLILLFRGPGIALPEVVIAQLKRLEHLPALRRFCRLVALLSSAALFALWLSPLLGIYLRRVVGLEAELIPFVELGVLCGLTIPFLAALCSYYRGVLMAGRTTAIVYRGMALNLVVTAVGIAAGVWSLSPGVLAAIVTVTAATAAETLYLAHRAAARQMSLPGAIDTATGDPG